MGNAGCLGKPGRNIKGILNPLPNPHLPPLLHHLGAGVDASRSEHRQEFLPRRRNQCLGR